MRHPWSVVFRSWCDQQELNQTQIAEQIGVTQSIVSAWSTGKRIPTERWQEIVYEVSGGQVMTIVEGYRRGVGLCDD